MNQKVLDLKNTIVQKLKNKKQNESNKNTKILENLNKMRQILKKYLL